MKKIIKISVLLVIVILLAGGLGMFYLSRGLDTGSRLNIGHININAIDDGRYRGEYKAGRFSNQVEVEVKDHQIVNISLVKDVVFSKPEVTEELINRIITSQKNNVDVIAGSTVTSLAYLKAVENALTLRK